MLLVLKLLVLIRLVLKLLVLIRLVLKLLVLIRLVLVLLILTLLVLMGQVKICFLCKSSGANPVLLMNDVRNTVFDRLRLKNPLVMLDFSIYFLAH